MRGLAKLPRGHLQRVDMAKQSITQWFADGSLVPFLHCPSTDATWAQQTLCPSIHPPRERAQDGRANWTDNRANAECLLNIKIPVTFSGNLCAQQLQTTNGISLVVVGLVTTSVDGWMGWAGTHPSNSTHNWSRQAWRHVPFSRWMGEGRTDVALMTKTNSWWCGGSSLNVIVGPTLYIVMAIRRSRYVEKWINDVGGDGVVGELWATVMV